MLDKLLGVARLVTLTGARGTGKTRLAVEFADGVWLADLAGLSDPNLVGAQMMEALGVHQAGDVPVIEARRSGCGRRSCCWRGVTQRFRPVSNTRAARTSGRPLGSVVLGERAPSRAVLGG